MNVYFKILLCTIFLYNCGICSGVHQCWFCMSETCNDPFNSGAAVNMTCSSQSQYSNLHGEANKHAFLQSNGSDFVCLKAVAKNGTGTVGTIRSCISRNLNYCQELKKSGLTVQHCSTCDGDLCNSAIEWKSSFSVAVAVTLTLLCFFLH
ncbi:unnamed protein product [Phyllotreta striolata]|uniref:Protein sleepless n=1 Tax=Phyllotreta striolata TaxID=444603 RepID=A0A9N9TXK1_PHYSR|nr:unnamed protein product [Phyllotreta striolata]